MNIINLFDNWNSVNSHYDFWQKHSISSFTTKFIKRIALWENAELIESNNTEFAKTFNVYSKNIVDSKEINIIFPIFSKMYISIILDSLIKNEGTLNIITKNSILDLIYENDDEDRFNSLVEEGRINVILTDYDLEWFFSACDNFSSLSLFFDRRSFDVSEMLLIKNEEDVNDAINIFNYFKDEFSK